MTARVRSPTCEVGLVQGGALHGDLVRAGRSATVDEREGGVVAAEGEAEAGRAAVADHGAVLAGDDRGALQVRCDPGDTGHAREGARPGSAARAARRSALAVSRSTSAPRTDTSSPAVAPATRPLRVLSMLSRSTKVPVTKETPSMTAEAVSRRRTRCTLKSSEGDAQHLRYSGRRARGP